MLYSTVLSSVFTIVVIYSIVISLSCLFRWHFGNTFYLIGETAPVGYAPPSGKSSILQCGIWCAWSIMAMVISAQASPPMPRCAHLSVPRPEKRPLKKFSILFILIQLFVRYLSVLELVLQPLQLPAPSLSYQLPQW